MPVKFLVVDDEPDVEVLFRHQFRRQVRAGEYEFVFAADGQEALERLEEHDDVALVLSDINMPRMDGLALLGRIAELDRLLKVVMVSAYGDLDNIRAAMNRGAFDFVTKPIQLADLEVTIAKALREIDGLRRAQALQLRANAIQREVDIARRIQLSLLPTAFPSGDRFELYATAVPASDVGGDLYDFVEVGPDRLGFVVGDVSGKGLGAALFMALTRTVTRTILRTAHEGALAPDAVVRQTDHLLREETRGVASMYVTLFFGTLDVRTGEVLYCNAGHNPPVLRRRDGATELLPVPHGPPVCFGSGTVWPYGTGRLVLAPGDSLLVYTDGVTEAFDAAREEFGEERLLASAAPDGAPARLVGGVHEAVRAFVGAAPQSDDLTMLALRYLGGA